MIISPKRGLIAPGFFTQKREIYNPQLTRLNQGATLWPDWGFWVFDPLINSQPERNLSKENTHEWTIDSDVKIVGGSDLGQGLYITNPEVNGQGASISTSHGTGSWTWVVQIAAEYITDAFSYSFGASTSFNNAVSLKHSANASKPIFYTESAFDFPDLFDWNRQSVFVIVGDRIAAETRLFLNGSFIGTHADVYWNGYFSLGTSTHGAKENSCYRMVAFYDNALDDISARLLSAKGLTHFLAPRLPFFAKNMAAGGGETAALASAALASATFSATVSSQASILSASTASDVQSAAASAVASVIAAASAADALDALSSRAASITAGADASDSTGAAVAALADLAAGADAGFGAGSSAAGFASLVENADAASIISALAQAAAAFTAGAAAGDAWTAETEAAQIASLSASSDAGAAFLAAAAAYGSLIGAASADESISATVAALASLSASSTAGATLTGTTSTPQGLLQAGAEADLVLSVIAQTSAAITAASQAGSTFVGVSSAEGIASLRGAVTLQAVLRAAPTLSSALRGNPRFRPH